MIVCNLTEKLWKTIFRKVNAGYIKITDKFLQLLGYFFE